MIGQFKPPYNESFQVPDPTVAQVLVGHTTTHTYAIPGKDRPGTLLAPHGASPVLGEAPPKPAWVADPGLVRGQEGWLGVRGGPGHQTLRFEAAHQNLDPPVYRFLGRVGGCSVTVKAPEASRAERRVSGRPPAPALHGAHWSE